MSLPPRPPREPLVPTGGSDLHRRDMTATFAADRTLGSVHDELKSIDQWLPIDGEPDLALADAVTRDSSGPLRVGFGGWRDRLLGVQFRDGQGKLITAGGRTVKNVAGYDLTKFLVGSFGCFGTPLTVTFRTARRSEAGVRALLPHPGSLNDLLAGTVRPHWCCVDRAGVHAGWFGRSSDLQDVTRIVRDARSSAPLEQEAERRRLWPGVSAYGRALLPPTEAERLIAEFPDVDAVGDSSGVLLMRADGSATTSRARTGLSSDLWPSLADRVARSGGTLWCRGEGPVPRLLTPGSVSRPVADVLRRLKRAFDPDSRLPPLPI